MNVQARCHVVDGHIEYILADVEPIYHQAVRDLGYAEVTHEFRRTLPVHISHLDQICQNFEQYAEEMVFQTAYARVIPWQQALQAFLDRVEPYQLDWWVGGSAALAIRGLDVTPRDFDIVIADTMRSNLELFCWIT